MLAAQRSVLEGALDGLRHVEPAGAHRSVERHDAMVDQPADELARVVARQVVHHQKHTEWGYDLGQHKRGGKTLLPALPSPTALLWVGPLNGLRQRCKDGLQLAFEPRMENGVGRPQDSLHSYLARSGLEQRQ
jgi:hypothetical protein